MSVTPIANQPIRFQNANSIDTSCDCMGQDFCQLINKDDQTQFQINSTNIITNGDFESNLDGWNIFEAIQVTAEITYESSEGECDGQIIVNATGGTPGYTYSINGGVFQISNTFSNLCAGNYTITTKDSVGEEGSLAVIMVAYVSCGEYSDSYLNDISGLYLAQIDECELNDFN